MPHTSSHFVISLDFELMWGVMDHATIASYGRNVLGVRDAIPRMLDLFERRGIRATWATVGYLFCESKDEIFDVSPALRPTYTNDALSNYSYVDEIGTNEAADPYFFGLSLLRQVQACPGQEIGTHTFSHYYCLEPGQDVDQFAADLDAAAEAASRRGVDLKSLVFPRNQYSEAYLAIAASKGIKTFRGNEKAWLYEARNAGDESHQRRALRLLDHYLNLSGPHVREVEQVGGLINVGSSRFLRPYSPGLHAFEGVRLHRMKAAMSSACERAGIFHLWWHPHNFGLHTDENIQVLTELLDHFRDLNERFGMLSSSMGDFA